MKSVSSKGTPLSVKLIIIIFLSVGLMVVDKNYHPFVKLRSQLESLMNPLYRFAHTSGQITENISDMLATKEELLEKNNALQIELLSKSSDTLLFEQLKHENNRLRTLLGSPLRQDSMKMVTQVLSSDAGLYNDHVIIDKGSKNGVYEGQPIVDEKGVIGQVVSVAEKTSQVMLLCDTQHGLPVQVLRSDMRAITIGNGCNENLSLEFLPNDLDISVGDELVTSGLDSNFPEGYPVAVVTFITKDVQSGKMIIKAKPKANFERLRYLLLLWTEQRNIVDDFEEERSR